MTSDLMFPSSGGSDAATAYKREFIPGDRERQPFELQGFRRTAFLSMHLALVMTSLCGVAYVIYVRPVFGFTALFIGYVFENLAFVREHIGFHTAFIELAEEKMPPLVHLSFIHHYRNVFAFHENWLESRISYILDPRSLPVALAKLLAGVLLVVAVSFLIDPIFGIALYACRLFPKLMQSIVHEWYHNPEKNRKTFYSFPVYWFLTALEKTRLASTRGHAVHHRHNLNNLEHVHRWLDLYAPFEKLGARMWEKALSLYEPGKTSMSDFVEKEAVGFVPLGLLLHGLYAASLLASYQLMVS